jgi:putative sterol carrier protein
MDHRLIRIDHGDISVSREFGPAECVATGHPAVFQAIALGRLSAMAAMLRGVLAVEGDPELLVLTQRLFAAPDGVSRRAAIVGERPST